MVGGTGPVTFDLFADPEPEDDGPPAPMSTPASTPQERIWTRPHLSADQPCGTRPGSGYVCAVGGGGACGSADGAKTWFCIGHRPWGWLPSERG